MTPNGITGLECQWRASCSYNLHLKIQFTPHRKHISFSVHSSNRQGSLWHQQRPSKKSEIFPGDIWRWNATSTDDGNPQGGTVIRPQWLGHSFVHITAVQWRTQEFFRGGVGGSPGIFFGRGSTNSVEDRGKRERRSGGGSPLVRGSTQFANEWNPYTY
jgi:hypothetical protein